MSSKAEPVHKFLFTDHTIYPNFSLERDKIRMTFEIRGFIRGHCVVQSWFIKMLDA